MPAGGRARLRDRRKESSQAAPSSDHAGKRRSHLSFLELNERSEDQAGLSADKSLASGQVACILDPSQDLREKNDLCDPCQVLAAAILTGYGTSSVELPASKGDAWTRLPGSDTLYLTDHHGDYEALVQSGHNCQLCYVLSTSWFGACGRQVRGNLKYRIQSGRFDHAFSIWTQKIKLCMNGCCAKSQQHFQKLRTFEPFQRREDTDMTGPIDANAFRTKNDRDSIYGREVALRSDSAMCTQMIDKWLKVCRTQHPDCSRHQIALLPKRVIDVRPPAGGEDCRLIEPLYREFAPYVALSHCWGGRSLFCTTRNNFQIYKECLLLEDFPKTFRDAVLLTRALGFQYLWIDALCIIQGDPDDWEEQADAVGSYYRNAVLTISATRAPDYNAGLFHPRKSVAAELTPELLPPSNKKRVYVREAYSPGPSTTTKISGPVCERGWVLQERLLSPAVLHFTKREIIWECRTQTIFEHGSYALPQDYGTKLLLTTGERSRTSRSTPAWRMQRKDRFREWYKLVQLYSAKRLTRTDDRLPAIAGLATRFHAMCHSTYLAGLWEDDAMRGLLWNTADQEPPTDGTLEERSVWHTPSWSWASTGRSVHYNVQLGDRIDKLSSKYSSTAVIHRVDVDKPNPKSFGHVRGGCLEMTGLLRPARLLKVRLHTIQMRWDRRPNCQLSKLWSLELGSWETLNDANTAVIIYFLLIEPRDPTGWDTTGYQRVGLAWCEWAEDGRPNIQPPGQSMKLCIV